MSISISARPETKPLGTARPSPQSAHRRPPRSYILPGQFCEDAAIQLGRGASASEKSLLLAHSHLDRCPIVDTFFDLSVESKQAWLRRPQPELKRRIAGHH